METVKRTCIKGFSVSDDQGNSFTLEIGKKYTTSLVEQAPRALNIPPMKNRVVVMSNYWVSVPIACFDPIVK